MRLELCIRSVLDAVEATLQQFGVNSVKRKAIEKKEQLKLTQDVTAFVGLVGDARGNIAYSFSADTAKAIASAMMMGMPVTEMNEISRSAIAELSNMITGNATIRMSHEQAVVDITPPSVVSGENMSLILSFMSTYCVHLDTPLGGIEVSFGVEL